MVKITESDYNASIVELAKVTLNVFIPHFFEKRKYKIIFIKGYAFENCNIDSLAFPNDTEIEIFEKDTNFIKS